MKPLAVVGGLVALLSGVSGTAVADTFAYASQQECRAAVIEYQNTAAEYRNLFEPLSVNWRGFANMENLFRNFQQFSGGGASWTCVNGKCEMTTTYPLNCGGASAGTGVPPWSAFVAPLLDAEVNVLLNKGAYDPYLAPGSANFFIKCLDQPSGIYPTNWNNCYLAAEQYVVPVPVVEYYHAAFDHYFITANPDEMKKLDDGTFAGWARTGYGFSAYPRATALGSQVCRFFSTTFGPKSSHFYTPFSKECADVKGNANWQFEGDVFTIRAPNEDGTCPGNHSAVYRLYNQGQGGAPNHRYTTDVGVRQAMIVKGWLPEGLGQFGVIMCAPQ